jgi:hypothetical protein
MIPYDEMEYNETSEQLVEILCAKTQNTSNPLFFRIIVGYYFSMMASMMRCSIQTHDTGDIPVNMYALNLSPSGTGKGKSTNLIENRVINLFRQRFMDDTFPLLTKQNLPKLATKWAAKKNIDPDDELTRVEKELESLGELTFSFSEATTPAIKQARQKLLMVEAGSLNLQIDEIGMNLSASIEPLTAYLELYDVGMIKQKLLKNSADSKRMVEIVGQTPANLLMFGAPVKLLDGGKNEEDFYGLLDTGYARRCIMGYTRDSNALLDLTPEEIYELTSSTDTDALLEDMAKRFEQLADVLNVNKKLVMQKETVLEMITYRQACERQAAGLPEHDEIRKTEMAHRYFKALKLAGAYAFIDDSPELTLDHLYQAIKVVEDSGEAFSRLLNRDRDYVKLAKYVSSVGKEVTQADLTQDLPFYRGSIGTKQEMLNLAIAWGYQHNVIIKKSYSEGIEFLRGETLATTSLDELIISYSDDMTTGYVNDKVSFAELADNLMTLPDYHWVSHHLADGYRKEDNCLAGFNMIVLDVDGGTRIDMVRDVLSKFHYLLYTTKRHTDTDHRFRVIIPMSHTLKFDSKEYKEFMNNICEWLPFDSDEDAYQRGRKWLTNDVANQPDGVCEYNDNPDAELFDVLSFIPKTSKNENRKSEIKAMQSMDKLERWVMNNIGDGNRNNMLHRYGMMLMDNGLDISSVQQKVMAINEKIADKLPEIELASTIFVTLAKEYAQRGG